MRRNYGEAATDRSEAAVEPMWSAGAVGTSCGEAMAAQWRSGGGAVVELLRCSGKRRRRSCGIVAERGRTKVER